MTDKPTPEQIQRACDLANGPNDATPWFPGHYGACTVITALADTIAKLDAMQAERDKAWADLREIDRLASQEPCNWIRERKHDRTHLVAAIAATYRVETDPLVAAMDAIGKSVWADAQAAADGLRAELAKRGLEFGRSA